MKCPRCKIGKLVKPSELGFDGDGVLICDNEDFSGQPCEHYYVSYNPVFKVSHFNSYHKGGLFAFGIAFLFYVLGVPLLPVIMFSLFSILYIWMGEIEYRRKRKREKQ